MENATDAQKGTDRTNHHWQDWEIALLIARSVEGEAYERIGRRLDRSGLACRKKLDRLVEGKDECPEFVRAELVKLRQPVPAPRQRSRGGSLIGAQVVEQYRTLARKMQEILYGVDTILLMAKVCLARQAIGAQPGSDEVGIVGDLALQGRPDLTDEIFRMADRLRQDRIMQAQVRGAAGEGEGG